MSQANVGLHLSLALLGGDTGGKGATAHRIQGTSTGTYGTVPTYLYIPTFNSRPLSMCLPSQD